jgi:uncharacterized protein
MQYRMAQGSAVSNSALKSWPSVRTGVIVKSIALGALLLAFAVVAERAFRIYQIERDAILPLHGSVAIDINTARVAGMQEVVFPSDLGELLAGWYVPSKNGAIVILLHGTTADRSSLLDEIRILATAGIGVLAYDSPGHGLSAGKVEWGAAERRAFNAAVTWAANQSGVNRYLVGVAGFSYGAYILAESAAGEPRVKRVALLAAPTDGLDVAKEAYGRWSPVAVWYSLKVDKLLGFDSDTMTARNELPRIAPRPLLLITGDRDKVVPRWMTNELFAIAGEPKQLLVIRGAAHGGYAQAEPERYTAALVRFFGPPASAHTANGAP